VFDLGIFQIPFRVTPLVPDNQLLSLQNLIQHCLRSFSTFLPCSWRQRSKKDLAISDQSNLITFPHTKHSCAVEIMLSVREFVPARKVLLSLQY